MWPRLTREGATGSTGRGALRGNCGRGLRGRAPAHSHASASGAGVTTASRHAARRYTTRAVASVVSIPTYCATVHAMAMPFTVQVRLPPSQRAATAAVDQLHRDLIWADEVFSLFKEDSQLSRLNRGELAIDECEPEVLEVLQTCEWYRSHTLGAFDARRSDHLDPTGIVKGWAVARAVDALDQLRAAAWMVGAAGDVLVSGEGHVWTLGIADPRVSGDPSAGPVIDVVALGGKRRALATSGVAHHGRHIWDPATGEGAQHYLQVSVVGPDLVTADAWATAIAAGGDQVLAAALDAGLDVLVVTRDHGNGSFSTEASTGWPSVRH